MSKYFLFPFAASQPLPRRKPGSGLPIPPWAPAFAGVAMLLAGSALAQADEPVEELLVVGARVPVSAERFGASFSVLDKAAIEARQVPVVAELLRDLPGLAVSRTGTVGSQTQIRIRGAEGNQTLVLIDGIEATDPVGNFEFDFADLVTTGIERIEVLRGPQGALYGSEAIGGVIQILTRDPGEGTEFEAFAEGGSFGTARLGATASAGTERLGATVSVGWHDTDGVSAAPGGTERDGYRNRTLSGKIVARPLDGLTLGLVARHVAAETEVDAQDFLSGRVVDADIGRDFEAFYGRAHAALALFDDLLTQTVSLELTDTDSNNVTDGAFDNAFSGERFKLRWQSTLDTGTVALTGAVEHEELRFRAVAADPADPANQRQKDDQTSLVGEARVEAFDRLFLTLGLRHDMNDVFADETTWRTTLALDIDAATQLHGSYGTGVSDPTFFDRFGFFPDQFIGNPDLTPERARGWDVGLRREFLDGRLRLDATWFSTDLRDEIVSVFDVATFLSTVENQAGQSDRRGVELAARYEPAPGLVLDAAWTFLDAEEPDGSREIRRARHIASFTATWTPANGRGEVSLDLDYNGEQDDLDFSAFPARRVTLDDFLLVTLAARWRLARGLELFGRIENLLDQEHSAVLGFNTPGIGAFGGLRARF